MKNKHMKKCIITMCSILAMTAVITGCSKEDSGETYKNMGEVQPSVSEVAEATQPSSTGNPGTTEPVQTVAPAATTAYTTPGISGDSGKIAGVPRETEDPEVAASQAVNPTAKPSVEEVVNPTGTPVVEEIVKSTVKPTVCPTVKPTVTVAPTVKPTTKPTVKPTTKPTTTPTVKPTVKPTTTPDNNSGTTNSSYVDQVLNLINEERAKEGLSPLTTNSSLKKAAQQRAKEIVTNFSHNRPDGSSGVTVLKEYSISYSAWGENIAYGQKTPAAVMNAWMNSSGHRANILSEKFGKVGIGCYEVNGTLYWTQVFTN